MGVHEGPTAMEHIGTIRFRCPKCGSEQFSSAGKNELEPQDVVTCSACGHQLTAGEALELAKQALQDELARNFGDAFKKR